MSFIDISVPLKHGMARYPGDPPIQLTKFLDMSEGADANVKLYSFGSHSATHFDAPVHQIIDGIKADEIPADYFIGKAKVFSFMSGKDIRLEDVQKLDIEKGDMVLFKTPNSLLLFDDEFIEDYAAVEPGAAQYLADIGVHAVGVDYFSIERFAGTGHETHHILLNAGIPIIEGLNLSKAAPGVYKMTAMFMLIDDSDGAPIRAILEKY